MPNEFVNALECIPLETQSTESGSKEYVVVGTTINRGEDLAVKGAVSNEPREDEIGKTYHAIS